MQAHLANRINKLRAEAAGDLASIEQNAEMTADQMSARRELMHFSGGFQAIALLSPPSPLVACYVDAETWRGACSNFHRHAILSWSESALGQGFATENALSIGWEALPAGLRGYFPHHVQVYCSACTRLREEAGFAAHEGSWLICIDLERLSLLKRQLVGSREQACAICSGSHSTPHPLPHHPRRLRLDNGSGQVRGSEGLSPPASTMA